MALQDQNVFRFEKHVAKTTGAGNKVHRARWGNKRNAVVTTTKKYTNAGKLKSIPNQG